MTAEAAQKPKAPNHPEPVYNEGHGRLLFQHERLWPGQVWRDRWSLPRYRVSAVLLAAAILGPAALFFILDKVLGGTELSRLAAPVYALLARYVPAAGAAVGLAPGAAQFVVDAIWTVIKVGAVMTVAGASPVFVVWWERKISAHIQSRFGPMYTGGFHGWLQTIADAIKLTLKENITPAAADKWVHLLGPSIVLAPALASFAPISFGHELSAADIDVGILYIFAVAGISVIGVLMAGWGSGNKYSLLGGLRSTAQMVSYELPRAFSIVPVLMFAGSMNLTRIAEAQSGYWLGFFPSWFIFYPVVGQVSFLVFLIASVAETNRTPFDIPEAESELVAGFHTEYSGIKFSMFFMAEYAYVLLACCITAAFFFGGGAAPLPFLDFIPSWAWFMAKVLVLIFCFLWFRWTFPRMRVDRLMDFCWKFLLPWSFANIAIAGLYLLF